MVDFLLDPPSTDSEIDPPAPATSLPCRQSHHHRHSLIACASLVENPMNLGALCRTAEVFRLESLVLSQLQIAQNQEFRKLAVSADQWQPLEACAVKDLPDWLEAKARLGYIPLALTPDASASSITLFKFPKRSLLVLGRELTGIPDPIQNQCRAAIAIPQYGQVKSLNVQTAAAIAIYEYARQHSLIQLPEV
ncbi:TrmH family RNA methyltransferase [filamentous cyanobacterium CCP5]|nr:TrmH family RNA methyltransferase [filamentous cyanobacterium CCP5]